MTVTDELLSEAVAATLQHGQSISNTYLYTALSAAPSKRATCRAAALALASFDTLRSESTVSPAPSAHVAAPCEP